MDPAISRRFDILRERVEFVHASSAADLAPVFKQASTVLRWRKDACPKWLPNAVLADWLSGKKVIEVDPTATRYEGSYYIDVSRALMHSPADVIAESRAKLSDLGAKLGPFDRAHVLATGPSVSSYARFDHERSLNVVCNTVILDQKLMATVKPQFLVFADPIFHFGPSEYAGTFRANVRQAAAEFDFTICIPLKYYAVFAAAVPELVERTIAIPFRKERDFNFDLMHDFELKTTANVLTFLMLPLAATFAKQVGILGCDGRPLHENTYFWKHGNSTQLDEKMANIRQVHPAFFDIAYNDYYVEHCETLEAQLEAGERLGRRFECLGPSHIPALRDRVVDVGRYRSGATPVGREEGDSRRRPNVLVIDPDAMDWGGHFMAYNDKLAAALEEQGAAVNVLCNKDLDSDILRERPKFISRLSVHTWAIGNKFASDSEIATCEEELTQAITELVSERPLIAYMYAGAVEHAAILARLIENEPELHAHVNLFWAAFHDDRWGDWLGRYGETLREVGSAGSRLRVTVPTSRLQRLIAEGSGMTFAVAPHPSTAVADRDFAFGDTDERLRGLGSTGFASLNVAPQQFRVLFPGNPREGKGFEQTLAAVARLAGDSALRPVMRYYPHPKVGDAHDAAVARLPESVEVVRGELDNEAFLDLFRAGHISVLPYEPAAFANRTSGLLIDSVYHGLPVVALRGTWLGEFVERYGCGAVADDHSPDRLATAVHEIVDNYSAFTEKARGAARSYFAGNSWHALADSILEPGIAMTTSALEATILHEAADSHEAPLLGPFSRDQKARIDETLVIARLIAAEPKGVMLDVGAHHGSSLRPFVSAGWSVVACEPDRANRKELIARFGSRDNITIDPRAVSGEPAQGVAFYSSDESTGISGLHAFRDTHRETGRVEVTTVGELVGAHRLSSIDFLKIDVEGHDWNVLKGVPWDQIEPDVIASEFEDAKTVSLGHTYRDIADYLVEKGYTVYLSEWHPIVRYGIRHEWRQLARYPAPLGCSDAWGNILAFRSDPGEEALKAAFLEHLEVENPAEAGAAIVRREVTQPRSQSSSMAFPTDGSVAPIGSSRYERFYLWAKNRNSVIFAVGRLAMWCGRKVRRYPGWTMAYLAVLAGLVVAGFLPAVEPHGPALWAAAGVVGVVGALFVVMGFMRFTIKEARHELEILHLSLRRRVERAEQLLRSEPQARSKLEAELRGLRADQETTRGELEAKLGEVMAGQENAQGALHSKLGELLSAQKAAHEALAVEIDGLKFDWDAAATLKADFEELKSAQKATHDALAAEIGGLRSDLDSAAALESAIEQLKSAQKATREALAAEIGGLKSDLHSTAALQAQIEQLKSKLEDVSASGLSIDIVSTLRQVHPLWVDEKRVHQLDPEREKEHGHALLMALLVEEARQQPGILKGRTLIEVGTTREPDPRQGSTEKLAIFTGLTDMRFISVDIDPANTQRANRVIQHLNPAAEAINERGESYLAACSEPLDYVYLDAFDFDHGQHSEERKERYREILKTEISDEASWQMHQLCAAAIITKMPEGGIVVIDDTWVDDTGDYAGKGKLAVPLLLASSFSIIAKAPRAIALKRNAAQQSVARSRRDTRSTG